MINTFFKIYIDTSLKYKRDIHMKFDVPLPFLSENVVYFLHLFIANHKECPLRKVK